MSFISYKTELKWAILFIIASVLWLVLAKILGMFSSQMGNFPIFSMLFIVPAVLIFIGALLDKKNNYYSGAMNFKQGFMSGMLITIFVTLCTPLSQYVFHSFIAPEFFPNIIQYSIDTGEMTPENAAAFFNLKSYIVQSSIASLVSGIITSLIVAFFVQSKNK
jgi:hypothetical protein